MSASSLFSRFSSDLAIDLGTANTLVFERNKGVVVNEPSIVAMCKASGSVEAVGAAAREMLGRTPEQITAIKPMKNGVIADFEATSFMLSHFIHRARRHKRFLHPRVVIGVPSEITPVERRAVKEACAKVSEVHLVQQPVMAAVGAGLPIAEPVGNLIVDIGGGTTDVAVISMAGVVYAHSVRMAGNAMDEMIVDHLKRRHNLLIGERTAEEIKIQIGSAFPLAQEMQSRCRAAIWFAAFPARQSSRTLRSG
jgi:rod shape-determining protein MreB